MGYQITWKKKELPEIDSKYKSMYKNSFDIKQNINTIKNELIIFMMNSSKSSELNIKTLLFKIKLYISLLEDDWKLDFQDRLKDDEEKIWFCGYEFSRNEEFTDYSDVIINSLVLYTFCTKESDPISDNEYFYEKLNKIEEELNSLEEYVIDKWNHLFVNEYRQYCIKYDE